MRSEINTSSHPAFPEGRPLKVGHRFLIVPGETRVKDDHRIPIRLSRGKAFGSGLHETTISCMEVLESLAPLDNLSVLDVGAGTGILSLAALALGAGTALALDIDHEAARTCLQNAFLNGVRDRLTLFTGTLEALDPELRFDLILSNIHGDIILKEAGRLAGHTGVMGHLVLSGMDYSDSSAVKKAMERNGMVEDSVFFLEDYVTQVWHRPPEAVRKEP